ncbi:MAG: isoprenylcysteine carboxylmethyltransferase family protein [Kiritimatiellae bacterium]|nr:isoprenylcysteine carboxylmethyltransferase family protein [Kiritimatiellia bacterium]
MLLAVLASMFQPSYNPFTITSKSKDKGTGAQIIWSVYVTQLAAILEATYVRYPQSVKWDTIAVVALVAMIVGFGIRTWSVLTLGNLFTMHLDIQNDHTVIRKGPYKIVRHPSYLGAFIMYISTIIFFHSWYSLVVAVVILPVAFVRRIHYEDKLLKAELGEEYQLYCQQVKRVLPWLW